MSGAPPRREPDREAAGFALLATVVVIAVLLVVGAATIQMTRTELHSGADHAARQQAFYIAEAGIQRGLAQLTWERAMASTYTTYSYSGGSESFGSGSYTVSITQDSQFPTDPTRKLITATGTMASQSAQVVAHAVVEPYTSSPGTTPTPTLGPNTTPTPAGNPTATPPGNPPSTSGTPAATATPGFEPTSTPGVPSGMPTPTPTPSSSVQFPPCNDHEILVSYNGTAKIINDVSALSNFIDGNGKIVSNGDVTFETDVATGSNATGTGSVYARGDFTNSGTNLNVFSNFNNVSLFVGGSYQRTALDVHVLGTCGVLGVVCFGTHFGTTGLRHGSAATIPKVYPWQPDWKQYERWANVIVDKRSQPFGSWDAASGTWVVGGYSFPAGSQTLYYVDGNVQLSGVSLFRTAAPRIVARGWISATSVTVLSSGLLSNDVQSIYLIGEKDVYVGRDVVSLSASTFQSETLALTIAQGLQLASVVTPHTLNLIAYSQRGDVWAMVNTLSAGSRPRLCLLGYDDATLAFTGSVLTSVLPLR